MYQPHPRGPSISRRRVDNSKVEMDPMLLRMKRRKINFGMAFFPGWAFLRITMSKTLFPWILK